MLVFLYCFLEVHVIGDILRGFHGGRVELTFHPASEIYHHVASKCRSLHGRYGCLGLAPQFSGSTNVRRVWSIVMKFMSWGSELRDTLIAFYDVILGWESWWIYGIIINLLIIQVPRRYLAMPSLASPHLQTLFLGISGRPPSFKYKRLDSVQES